MILKHKEEPLKFQGKNRNEKYFEGWYFKHVSADLKNAISIIPGISKVSLDSHAFIQVILLCEVNGIKKLESHYIKFSTNDFKFTESPFSLKIKNNIFTHKGVEVNLTNGNFSISGKIRYDSLTNIKRNIISPNAMGFFAYFPFMECYHDIISMKHNLKGSFSVNNTNFDFHNGRGYIEKDWGISFPEEYIWLQSNHFGNSDASIMFSLAHIPFVGTSFQGFICNLTFNGQEYRFATYNNSKVTKMNYDENMLEFMVAKGKYKLDIRAGVSHDSGILKAPKKGNMNVLIKEGLSGNVDIRLHYDTKTLFEGSSKICAIEIHK